jgi:predicted RNA binding protein YcfA (HicA-like mRNA interferase family)
MTGPHNLKPDRVIRTLVRIGLKIERQTGSHVILSKEGYPGILSIPVHKGKPIKQGLLKKQIELAGMTLDDFLKLYK